MKAKAEGRKDESAAIFDKEFLPAAPDFQQGLKDLVTLQRKKIDTRADAINRLGLAGTRIMELVPAAAVLLGALSA